MTRLIAARPRSCSFPDRLSRLFVPWLTAVGLVAMSGFLPGCGGESPTPSESSGEGSTGAEERAPRRLAELVRQGVDEESSSLATPDGRLRVDIPAGAFAAADELIISRVESETTPISEAFTPLGLYDVSTVSGAPPQRPVTITLTGVGGSADATGDSLRLAAWYHEELEAWISVPAVHDPQADEIRFDVPHFTLFGWFSEKAGYLRGQIGDFELLWDAKVFEIPAKVTDPAQLLGKITYESANDFATYLTPGEDPAALAKLPPMVRDAGVYLNYALRKYKEAGFKMPSLPIPVVVETTLTSENARVKAMGVIHLGEYNLGSHQLKLAVAHELFHSVQNEYLWSLGGMTFLGWWCESTAEYAGSAVWKAGRPSRRPAAKYFSEALTSTAHEHEYESAHFIDCVVGSGTVKERLASLRKLWVGTLAQHGVTDMTDVTFPMSMYVKSSGGSGVNDRFREHVYDLFFSPTSPMVNYAKGANPKIPAAEMMEGWALLETGKKETAPLKMSLKGDRRAKAWGVKAQPASSGANRQVELEVGGPLSGNVVATVHVLTDDLRADSAVAPTARLTAASPKTTVSLGVKDAAYVVVVNTGGSGALALTLDVRDAAPKGGWRLLSAQQAAGDPFLPNLKMMRKSARLVSGPGDPYTAWIIPHEEMEVRNRTTFQFDAEVGPGEIKTFTSWKETVRGDAGKRDVDLRLSITRSWSPAMPSQLKPGDPFDLTEKVAIELEPAEAFAQLRYRPQVTGLVMTSIDRERLGALDYTEVSSEGYRGTPIEAVATHAWTVPEGSEGDRLRIQLRAADSAPADLGQSSGTYLDQFQSASLLYIYEYRQ